jgi:RimJ/RimL family protein N-acetyltransferase/predicted N-acetyltransferase YhbS
VPASVELSGKQVTLRVTEPRDADALRAIRRDPEISRWWDELEREFPMDDPDSDLTRLTIRAGDEIIGMIQFAEDPDPKYRSASLDLFIAPSRQRRGFGSEAIRLLVDHLLAERGHHRLTIDPAAHNEAAIACYSRAGFREVGRMRSSERDRATGDWHDQLLMELVVGAGGAQERAARRNGYEMSTDPARLDREAIWAFLTKSYWAEGIPRDLLDRSIDRSLSFGVYAPDGSQAGYARVVTDGATFAWIGDLFVIEEHRGRGLGKWLVEAVLDHPDLRDARKIVLATADAQGLYRRFGFRGAHPERMMEISLTPDEAYGPAGG